MKIETPYGDVFVFWSLKSWAKALKRRNIAIEPVDRNEFTQGLVCQIPPTKRTRSCQLVLINKKSLRQPGASLSEEIIAHESLHVVQNFQEKVYERFSKEAEAYLLGYLVDKLTHAYKRKK